MYLHCLVKVNIYLSRLLTKDVQLTLQEIIFHFQMRTILDTFEAVVKVLALFGSVVDQSQPGFSRWPSACRAQHGCCFA